MSTKSQIKSGYRSYFVTVVLEKTVYCIGMGFTDTLYRYVLATDKVTAQEMAANFYESKDFNVKITQASSSAFNVLSDVFKDQVLGFEEGTCLC